MLGTVMLAALATASHAADPYVPPSEPVVTPQEYSQMGFYLRGDIGWSFLEWSGGDDDNDIAFGGGIGYDFENMLRTDLRIDYAGEYDTGVDDFGVTTLLGNVYLDFDNDSMITPYVGAGAGYGWTDDDNGFAYALMGGASVDFSDSVAMDVGYRFRALTISGDNPYEHQIMTGLRFKF
jgi:opacity protein-like surface antigen